MNNITQLCQDTYLNHGNEEKLLAILNDHENLDDTFNIAQEFYFAMEDENIVIIVPKSYWDKHQAIYPNEMKVIDNFLSMVGYQFNHSYYELDHDDYHNHQFMIDNGFVENEQILEISYKK